MTEVSDDAMFLISISYQALDRIKYTGRAIQLINRTITCDELVTVVFLGFYLEASLTDIIKKMGETEIMNNFFKPKRYLGLKDKFAWFYNEHIAATKGEIKVADKEHLFIKDGVGKYIMEKLDNEFPGFKKIYDFRNDIAHGDLGEAIKRIKTQYNDTNDVNLLRTHAKEIVDNLITISREAGYNDIGKNIPYDDALNNYVLDNRY
jgi:hypothetical protein